MKKITWLLPLVVITISVNAQKKEDRKTIGNLQSHITFLSSNKLESRSTGAPGEQLAANYLAEQMKNSGLTPMGNDGYLQAFTVKESREPSANCSVTIDQQTLKTGRDFLPLPFSAQKTAKGEVITGVNEPDNIWFINMEDIDSSSQLTTLQQCFRLAKEAEKAGATGVIFYNGKVDAPEVQKWLQEATPALSIPAVWVNDATSKLLSADDANGFQVNIRVAFDNIKRNGTNVIGYINNKADRTIILGAHYDFPGWDSSVQSSNNASGTAALLELARLLRNSSLHNNNYLVVAFSGKEQNLAGSNYFAAHPTIDLSTVNYMINLDGIGQLSPDQPLQVNGSSSSDDWTGILQQVSPEGFRLNVSNTAGVSDHAAFFKKHIPVLSFSTNSLVPENNKINYDGTLGVIKLVYRIIDKTNSKDKLAFTSAQ
ncbi:Peptidase family M28 [Chitinophaga terrae (ex Kim and Jung 2007)]|uniref:Peptidase family M28 n=1 Tax=Chitinophaga terrae (ex Kim and Jung 2007) TaxID=408074 RepID=A0A1H4G4B4_9BACT|nr:M28 family metallopeptidase [Chitinophaga terrae (ex Kim and Jung 2007)]SEB04394.1 Peptidase family M28 [Chitinophaga terrae (ex Kim and Jung 2007)]